MKGVILASLVAIALSASAATDKDTKKQDAKPAANNQVTIPKDAISNGHGGYIWTDKEGRKWLFVNTPFGVSKTAYNESAELASPPQPAKPDPTKVIDHGDTVRFERPTPFGTKVWEKKKSELTDDERKLYEAQQSKSK